MTTSMDAIGLLSAATLRVRQIQAEANSPCRFLTVMEMSGGMFYSSLPEARQDMLSKIRGETVRVGGNAYILTSLVAERGFSSPFAQGDAYRCP